MTKLPLMFDSATPWDEHRLSHIKRLSPNGAVSIYIRGTPGGFRHASADDVKLIRKIGLGIYPNWESTADFFNTVGGRQAKAAGQEAARALHDLGLPTDGTLDVPFSWDYDMPESTFEREAGDLVAAQEGLGGVATAVAYGPSAFIKYLHDHGYAKGHVHWLMMSTFGKTYVINQPGVGVVQAHDEAGNWIQDPTPVGSTDINTITKPEQIGIWWPDDSPYGGNMATVTHLEDSAIRDILQFPLIKDKDGKTVVTVGGGLRQLVRQSGKQLDADAAIKAQLAKLKLDGPEAAAVEAAVEQGLHDFYAKAVTE